MRILVVDDEMISRMKMEALMQTFGACTAADSGNVAIYEYKKALTQGTPFQIVMLDIDMPDMRGTQVLKNIRKLEATASHRAVVVMVTAQLTQDQVVSCIQEGCDDYIAKPFNIEVIRSKLMKFGVLGRQDTVDAAAAESSPPPAGMIYKVINNTLRSGELVLPAMPQIGIKFREMVRNGAEMDEMAVVLKKDVVIASKLIRLANSAIYRGYGKIQNLEQAIGRLGLAETEKMVMAISSHKLFMVEDRRYRELQHNLWLHSLACAHGAEILSQSLERNLAVDPFTAGLFHDIGAFALIHIIAEMEKLGRYEGDLASASIEETVQSFHAQFGAKLLEKWDFDREYIQIAMCHNDLEGAESRTYELLIVHFCNQVAKSLGYAASGMPEEIALADAPSALNLQLTDEQISDLGKRVQSEMAKAVELGD